MSGAGSGDRRSTASRLGRSFDVEELRRRNPNAVAMDVLYLITTAFFVYLALQGPWPAAVAAIPFVTLMYFGAKSSPAFFVAQLLAIGLTLVADWAGAVPL